MSMSPDSILAVIDRLRALTGSPILNQPSGRGISAYAGPGRRNTPQADEDDHVMRALAEALRSEVGDARCPAKQLARAANASPRTAKGWLARESTPQAVKLIALMREYDSVFDAVLKLAGRKRPGELSASERSLITQALRILDEGRPQ